MANKKIIAVDTETSGLDMETSQVMSMSLRAIDPITKEVVDSLSLKIGFRGDVKPEPGAVAVTGVNPFRHKGLTEADAAERLKEFLERNGGRESPVLGQNVSFDKLRLRNLLSRNGHDAHLVSLGEIELMKEAVNRIGSGELDPAKFEQKTNREGRTVPSLRLASIVKATGGTVDETKTHDDAYDLDITIDAWRRMGAPTDSSQHPMNHPYKVQDAFRGKIVRAKEWDGRMGEFRTSEYYVVGKGAGEVEDSFGKEKYNATILIKLGTPEFDEVMERAGSGRLTATSLKAATSLRGFASDHVVDYEVRDADEAVRNKIMQIEDEVVRVVEDDRRKEREADHTRMLSAASLEAYNLDDPNATDSLISSDDESLIPVIARDAAGKGREALMEAVEKAANSSEPKKGVKWAHALRTMVERYGYRNNLEGYADARAETLSKFVKPEPDKISVFKPAAEQSGPVVKALAEKGASGLRLECDGSETRVAVVGLSGETLSEAKIGHAKLQGGRLDRAKATEVTEAIQNLLGVSASAANGLRRGFETFADNESFAAMVRSFRATADELRAKGEEGKAKAVEETLLDMGGTFNEFAANSERFFAENITPSSPSITVVGEVDLSNSDPIDEKGDAKKTKPSTDTGKKVTKKGVLGAVRAVMEESGKLAADLRREIEEEYKREPLSLVRDDASNMDRIVANLTSPSLVKKRVDMEAFKAGLGPVAYAYDKGSTAADLSEIEPQEVDSSLLPSALPALPTDDGDDTQKRRGRRSTKLVAADDEQIAQCKVCRRWVKSKNAVSGMGSTCARRLGEWLEKTPDSMTNEVDQQKFKKIGEIKESGVYPIMIVRDTASGKTFAADVIGREKDGRYLVIDLSQVAGGKGGGGASIRDAVRVYLDSSNHEVAKVFKSKA
jgi:hypothetical protein